MAIKTVADLTALTGANTALDDQFLLWDTSAGVHKKITRAEMAQMFFGTGNVATNTVVGAGAVAANTTGASNTAVGYVALNANTTGTFNTGLGAQALRDTTTGYGNVAVGSLSLTANTNGFANVAVGHGALGANTTGTSSVGVGYLSLAANTTGAGNTAVGVSALAAVTTGTFNTAIGISAGANLTTGSNNTLIGNSAAASAVGVSNEVTLGNASVAVIRAQVTSITALSDGRDKRNIEPLALGMEFIDSLEPVKFEWDMRDGAKVGQVEAGFVAQQMQHAQDLHSAEWLGLVYDSNPDRLEASPGKLIPPIVLALQQLNARIAILETA